MARILIHSNAAWASCYDDKTELLTKRGWLFFKDVTENDVAMTFNVETSQMEWQQVLNTTVQHIDNKDMVSIKGRSIDLLVTPNHKILARKWKSNKWFLKDASELYGSRCLVPKSGKWIGNTETDFFVLPRVENTGRWGAKSYMLERLIPIDSWVKFMGYYLSEGYIDHNAPEWGNYTIGIRQIKDGIEEMADALKDVTPYRISIRNDGRVIVRDKQLWSYLRQFGYSYEKFVPSDIKELSVNLLQEFLDAYIQGDGCVRGERLSITTTSPKMIDDLQEISIKCGYATTITKTDYPKPSCIKGRIIYSARPRYDIYLSENKDWGIDNSWGIQKYIGNVYCAHVPNRTLLVRRNGRAVFCGNSGYGVMTKNLSRRFKDRLHQDVAVSAFYGLQGSILKVDGMDYYPMGLEAWGNDIIEAHASHFKANCVLTIIDLFVLRDYGKRMPGIWYPYFPLDGDPVSENFINQLQGAVKGLVYAKFAEDEFKKVKTPCSIQYIPIGVDTKVFKPLHPSIVESKKMAKRALGYPEDMIIVGMVSANQSTPDRKCFTEQIEAFMKFHEKYPNSRMRIHTDPSPRRQGIDLNRISELLGAKPFIDFPNEYQYHIGFDDAKHQLQLNCFDILTHCVPGNTEILTTNGSQPIDSLLVGDNVITHTGNDKQVTKVFRRHYSGDIVKITPFGYPTGVEFTPEHPILAIKNSGQKRANYNRTFCRNTNPEWVRAGDISKGDIIVTPRYNPQEFGSSSIYLNEYIDNCHAKNGFLVYENRWETEIPNRIAVDEQFAKLAGYFIAEGCANEDGLIFSLNSNEADVADELKQLIKSKFNLEATVTTYDRHRLCVRCYNAAIGRFFRDQFGHGAHNKHVPSWLFNRPSHILRHLLSSLFIGDGSCSSRDGASYSTVSKKLAYQIVSILGRLGHPASILDKKFRGFVVKVYGRVLRRAKYINKNNSYDTNRRVGSNCFKGDNYIYRPVRSIETRKYDGEVYNLAVSDDESYVAGLVSAHNCSAGEGFGMSILEAQACGTPVITARNTAMIELTGSGWIVDNHHKEYYALGVWHYRPEVNDIYEAMLAMAESDKEAMGKKAREFIMGNKYDWDDICDTYWKPLFDEVDDNALKMMDQPTISVPSFKEEKHTITIASMIKEMNSDTTKFLKKITSFDYDKSDLDYVFMVSSKAMPKFKKWQQSYCPKSKVIEDPKVPQAKTRIERLVTLRNELLAEVKTRGTEYALFVDSDMVNWNDNILKVLINDHADVIAPLVLLDNTRLWFYDCWSFRIANQGFMPQPPYNQHLGQFGVFGLMESVGSFFLARQVAIAKAEFGINETGSDCTYLCNKINEAGYKIAIDTATVAYHSDVQKDCGEAYWRGPIVPQELQDQVKDLIAADTTKLSTALLDQAYKNYTESTVVKEKGIRWAYNLADFYTFYMNNNPQIVDIVYNTVEMPHYVEIETSTKCPIKCSHCELTHWDESEHLMSYDQYKHILDEIPNLKWAGLAGIGHHWMNPEFAKMVELTKSRNIYIEQFDDMLFMNKERASMYIDKGFERLIVSLEAATPETFYKLRPNSNWDKVISNITQMAELKKAKNSHWPEIAFHYIIDKNNLEEAPLFLDLMFQLGINPLFVQYTRLLHYFPEIKHLYTEIPNEIRQAIDARSKAYNIPIQWNADAAIVKPSSRTCTAWTMPYIFVTGEVQTCCAENESNNREYQKKHTMGNIFEQSMKDIWYGEKFTNFRRILREGNIPPICVGCPIRQFPKGAKVIE